MARWCSVRATSSICPDLEKTPLLLCDLKDKKKKKKKAKRTWQTKWHKLFEQEQLLAYSTVGYRMKNARRGPWTICYAIHHRHHNMLGRTRRRVLTQWWAFAPAKKVRWLNKRATSNDDDYQSFFPSWLIFYITREDWLPNQQHRWSPTRRLIWRCCCCVATRSVPLISWVFYSSSKRLFTTRRKKKPYELLLLLEKNKTALGVPWQLVFDGSRSVFLLL